MIWKKSEENGDYLKVIIWWRLSFPPPEAAAQGSLHPHFVI
jgi:hypothetical protein